MASNEYWQERSVSWRSVAAGFTLAALAMTGLLVLEVATHFTSGTEGSRTDVSLPVAGSNALVSLKNNQLTERTADDFAFVDSPPDEEEHLFDCPHCE